MHYHVPLKFYFSNCLVVTEGSNRLTANDAQKPIRLTKRLTYFTLVATPTTRTATLIGLRGDVGILTNTVVQTGLMPSTVVKI